MTSSGYKRGLATAAISAMAVTGLPFFAGSASAVTLATAAGGTTAIDLVTFDQSSSTITTKNDGQNTTFRLEAVAGSGVSKVRFEYSIGAATTRTPIATVDRNDDGAFMTEWNAAGLNGANLTIYAVAVDANGADIAGAEDSSAATVDNTAESVNVTDGAQAGVFQQPYAGEGQTEQDVVVQGTASAAGAVDLSFYDSGAWQSNGDTATAAVPTGGTTATWAGVMDITGYTYGANDQLLVGADNGASDDSEAYALYKQTITTVTATPDKTTVAAGDSADVTVKVTDQNGKPIAGAQVFSSDGSGPKYTDGNGETVFAQNAGTANNAYYYANATDSNGYDPELGDKKSDTVAIAQYNPAATSLAGNSRDGAAFDVDEYDADDITVQVKDQQNNNYDTTNQTLQYYWVFTPAAGGTATRTPTTGTTPATENPAPGHEGEYIIGAPSNGFADDGTYELYAGLDQDPLGNGAITASKVLTVSSGDAEIVFDKSQPQQAVIGSDITINGTLRLWQGGPGLPGRPIQVSYTGTNASFNQPTGPDASPYNTKTDANGNFTAVLDDPNADTTAETGIVTAKTTNWAHGTPVDNDDAIETADQDVSFVQSTTPATVTVNEVNTKEYNGWWNGLQPGELAQYEVCVRSADDPNTPADESVALTNQSVTLTADHGYFTDGQATPAAAAKGLVGTWDNDGQSKTVTTDGNGCAKVWTSIGRDAGFDDDGTVTQVVTAKAGSVTKAADGVDWTSENPLNGSSVTVDFASDDQQDSTQLPDAQAGDQYVGGQAVQLIVKAFDQFNNRVGGETVNLTDNTNKADVNSSTVTDYDEQSDATADATDGVDQKITATWTAPTTTYDDASGQTASTANYSNGSKDLTDDVTINWYAIDYAASTFTLESDADGAQPVGSSVIVTYTATDQEGQPIVGLDVGFMRTGPDQYQDGDFNSFDTTNANGEANYVFQGAKPGTATITAIAGNYTAFPSSFSPIGDSRATTTVQFGEAPPSGPVDITVRLTSPGDNGGKPDVLDVKTRKLADGAVVKLFKNTKKGKIVKPALAQGTIGADGKAHFKVKDLNGNKVTRYIVKVMKTAKTKAGVSNVKGVR